jgi:hypothetical protein
LVVTVIYPRQSGQMSCIEPENGGYQCELFPLL